MAATTSAAPRRSSPISRSQAAIRRTCIRPAQLNLGKGVGEQVASRSLFRHVDGELLPVRGIAGLIGQVGVVTLLGEQAEQVGTRRRSRTLPLHSTTLA